MLLTKDELDNMGCTNPGCRHTAEDCAMTFHSRCHPHDPTWVRYQNGIITVVCAECDSIVASIEVMD